MNKTDKASCKHLTHKHASYNGCTLEEVLIIAAVYFVIDILVSIVLTLFYGMFFLFFVVTFSISIVLWKKTTKRIGKLKEGKQVGYLTLRTRQWLHKKFGIPLPFATSRGIWSTRRRV